MTDRIIADGYERLMTSPKMREKIAEIERTVEERYAEELAQAGWIKRRLIRAQMERDVRRMVDRIAPDEGLY